MNYKEIKRILEEIDFNESRLQAAFQLSIDTYIFEFYSKNLKKFYFFIKLTGQSSRICLIDDIKKYPLKKDPRPKRFLAYLRANLVSKRINKVYQIEDDRIIVMDFFDKLLYIRLYSGSKANMIVTDQDNIILELAYRREEVRSKLILDERKIFSCDDILYKDSYNKYIEEFYFQKDKREQLDSILIEATERHQALLLSYNNRIKSLNKTILNIDELNESFRKANLLNENRSLLKGKDSIVLDGLKIKLDPKISISDNINNYYERSKKEKKRLSLARSEKEFIKDLILKERESFSKLMENQNITALKKYLSANEKKKPEEGSLLTLEKHGCKLIIGKNDKQSEKLLKTIAKGKDYWVHVRNCPGSHLIIKNPKDKPPSLEVILYACQIATYFSKLRRASEVDLYYTQVKNLKRIKGESIVKVIPMNAKNMHIKVDRSLFQTSYIESFDKDE